MWSFVQVFVTLSERTGPCGGLYYELNYVLQKACNSSTMTIWLRLHCLVRSAKRICFRRMITFTAPSAHISRELFNNFYERIKVGWYAIFYFMAIVLFGQFFMLNLVLAVLLESCAMETRQGSSLRSDFESSEKALTIL